MDRINELVDILSKANKAYEQDNSPIMTDYEYDKLYDELLELEAVTGLVLEESPTKRAGHEVVSGLSKIAHESRLLSLDKTKDTEKLVDFLRHEDGEQQGILSWKLDGLSLVLKYAGGKLVSGVTRGNGEIGEDVTHNARFLRNIPREIDFEGELAIRGEAVIRFTEFERINEGIDEDKYKNPRNLCAGTIRQLNSRVAASRNVDFFAFSLMKHVGIEFSKKSEQMAFLARLGFELAEYALVDAESVAEAVDGFKCKVTNEDFATDGLVLTYDDIALSVSLGATSKFPRDSLAFKWADEMKESCLLDIQWHTSRTGLINPIAIFEPVELEGTQVERASLHNLSIVEKLELGVGDVIRVFKANMIIPQIAENITKSGGITPPKTCSACGAATIIKEENDTKTLNCPNPNCKARLIYTLAHYAGRDGMNIEGFSKQTVEKFIEMGLLNNYGDIYELHHHEEAITAQSGFGKRSFEKLIEAIEASKTAKLANFINALGVDNVGLANAKQLCRYFDYDIKRITTATAEEFAAIEGFGQVIADSLAGYFANAENLSLVNKTSERLMLEGEEINKDGAFAGKTFVITGDLMEFKNRKEMIVLIESLGGKAAGSVSKSTDFLVNNNPASTSSKNKKARELGIPIITEIDFITLANR